MNPKIPDILDALHFLGWESIEPIFSTSQIYETTPGHLTPFEIKLKKKENGIVLTLCLTKREPFFIQYRVDVYSKCKYMWLCGTIANSIPFMPELNKMINATLENCIYKRPDAIILQNK